MSRTRRIDAAEYHRSVSRQSSDLFRLDGARKSNVPLPRRPTDSDPAVLNRIGPGEPDTRRYPPRVFIESALIADDAAITRSVSASGCRARARSPIASEKENEDGGGGGGGGEGEKINRGKRS